jgi:hypothetical protein
MYKYHSESCLFEHHVTQTEGQYWVCVGVACMLFLQVSKQKKKLTYENPEEDSQDLVVVEVAARHVKMHILRSYQDVWGLGGSPGYFFNKRKGWHHDGWSSSSHAVWIMFKTVVLCFIWSFRCCVQAGPSSDIHCHWASKFCQKKEPNSRCTTGEPVKARFL